LSLKMRELCGRCGVSLSQDGVAFVCSYECTFCEGCAGGMGNVCPNCGELVRRPRRVESAPAKRT